MFYLGKIVEYSHEKRIGYLSRQDSAQLIKFYGDDFPHQGGRPQLGENVKYYIKEHVNELKADRIVRLDVAVSEDLIQKKPNVLKQHNILKRGAKDHSKRLWMTMLSLMIIAGIVYLGAVSWNQYQKYENEQQAKLALFEQQQKQVVESQRQAIGYVKPVIFSEKSKNALNEKANSENKKTDNDANLITTQTLSKQNTVNPTAETSTVAQFKCDGRTHCSQMHSYDEAVFFLRNCPNTKMDGNHNGIPCERQFHR